MTDSTSYAGLNGTVVAVASNARHEFSKPIKNEITLVANYGVEGDAHAGQLIQHRYLAKTTPLRPNDRQIHLMASELFTELAASGFNITPGQLGENVITAGLDLIRFPLGTRLRIGSSAIVELTGLRTPCTLLDRFQKGLKRAMIRQSGHPGFRCGVLGTVSATGRIMPGDPVVVDLPRLCRTLPEL
jgi:hypothetical protein